jgi:hypothetical protein
MPTQQQISNEIKLTRSLNFKDGTLDFGVHGNNTYVRWSLGHKEWTMYGGWAYNFPIHLGDNWFVFTQYWEGTFPADVPCKLTPSPSAK